MLNSTLISLAVMLSATGGGGHTYSDSCLEYVRELANETALAEVLFKYLAVSGHGFNQLGLYHDCLNLPNSSYYLSFLTYQHQPLPLFIGFCFTNQCTTTDINQLVNIFDLPYGFANLSEPHKWKPPVDTLTYVTIALLGLLALLCIVGTVVTMIFKNRKEKQKIVRLLKHFSLHKSLSNLKTKSSELKYLNGIRAISFFSVVFGHELFLRYNFSENYMTMLFQLGKAYLVYIYSYVFCVDVFFFLGGFLVGLLFLKVFLKRPQWMMFPKAFIQRVLRFWPVYIITILLYWKIAPLLGDGPLYYTLGDYVKTCSDSYWSDLLFFTNFRSTIYCTGWTWYVNVDMQMFVVSLAILAVYVQRWRYSKLLARFLGLSIIVGTVVYVFIECQVHHYRTFTGAGDDPNTVADYQTKIYLRPWSRAAPYMLGLLAGIFYYNLQEAIRRGNDVWIDKIYRWRLARIISTVAGILVLVLYIYAPYHLLNGKNEWTQLEHSLYLSTGHIGFAFGVFLMLMPIFLGYSNPIQTFLEIELLQLVAKLSFSSYMIHFIVLIRLACNISSNQYTNSWRVFLCGCSDVVVVLVCGFLVFVTVESPFASLLDSAFGKRKHVPKHSLLEDKI